MGRISNSFSYLNGFTEKAETPKKDQNLFIVKQKKKSGESHKVQSQIRYLKRN